MEGLSPRDAKSEALARFNDPGPDHINCAQAVVYFALLTLGAEADHLTTARYFGGGIAGLGETCGAITGSALALGLRDQLAADDSADAVPQTREQLQAFVRDFTRQFGACRCNDLTGFDMSTPEGHDAFMASEARGRCKEFVGSMCDRLAPLLLDPNAGPKTTEEVSR